MDIRKYKNSLLNSGSDDFKEFRVSLLPVSENG